MGFMVAKVTSLLTDVKFETANGYIGRGLFSEAYFSFLAFCLFYALIAGILCWIEPAAAGSGIPEIKAYLNGINLNKVVRIRVLYAKVIGTCFSVAAGLALGKEGPMIHACSIVGAGQNHHFRLRYLLDKVPRPSKRSIEARFCDFRCSSRCGSSFSSSYWRHSVHFRGRSFVLVHHTHFSSLFLCYDDSVDGESLF